MEDQIKNVSCEEMTLAGVFWDFKDVQKNTSISPTAVRDRMRMDPAFPRPFVFSQNKKLFSALEIVRWITSQEREAV